MHRYILSAAHCFCRQSDPIFCKERLNLIICPDHLSYFLFSNFQEVVIDGQPTHQTNYDVRKHVRVYLGLNNMPLERKDDDPELVYGVERAVSGRAQNGIQPQIILMEEEK